MIQVNCERKHSAAELPPKGRFTGRAGVSAPANTEAVAAAPGNDHTPRQAKRDYPAAASEGVELQLI